MSGAIQQLAVQATAASTPATVFNVQAFPFNAAGDGIADDTGAIQAALNAAAVAGGIVLLPPGTYFVSATLDMTGGGASTTDVQLWGSGPVTTTIVTSVTTTAGILAATSGTRFQRIQNLSLYQSGRVLPAAQRAGNYGIATAASGVGYSLVLDHVEVVYFGNAGVYLQGATGPTCVRDCSIQYTAGYGVQVATGGSSPQDVCIEGGNIQNGWGGIQIGQSCNSFSILAVDIELTSTAKYPALYLEGAGGSVVKCTVGLAAVTTPNALVYCKASAGCVFVGGYFIVTIAGVDTIQWDTNTNGCVIAGGTFVNVTPGGGYFVNVLDSSATGNVVIAPYLGTFTAGHNVVTGSAAVTQLAVGSASALVGSTTVGAFGCNSASAQTAAASGGALAAYSSGTNGFDTAGHAQALYNLVVAMRAALVANGIMS